MQNQDQKTRSEITDFENDIHALLMISDMHYKSAVVPLINQLESTQGLAAVVKSTNGITELNEIMEKEELYILNSLSSAYKTKLYQYYSHDGLMCFIKCLLMDSFKNATE